MHWIPPLPISQVGKEEKNRLWNFKHTYEGFLRLTAHFTSAAFPECASVTWKVFCYCYKRKVNSEAIFTWHIASTAGVCTLVFAIHNTF